MTNPSFIFKVRLELNDIPEDFLSDEVIGHFLTKADKFISSIIKDDADPEIVQLAVISLAAYYCYDAYTEIVARKMGTIPEYNQQRAEELKKQAYSYITMVVSEPIDEDLKLLNPNIAPVSFGMAGILP